MLVRIKAESGSGTSDVLFGSLSRASFCGEYLLQDLTQLINRIYSTSRAEVLMNSLSAYQ